MLKDQIRDEKRQEKEKKKEEKARAIASPARRGRGNGKGRGGRGRGRGQSTAPPPEAALEAAADEEEAAADENEAVDQPPRQKRARTKADHLASRGLLQGSSEPLPKAAAKKRPRTAAVDEPPESDDALMGLPADVHVPEPKAKAKGRAKAKAKGRARAKASAQPPTAIVFLPRDEERVNVAMRAIDDMILKCADMAFDTLKGTLIGARRANKKFELNVYWTRATVGLKMPEVVGKPQVVQFHFSGDPNVIGSWNARMVTAFVVAHELVPWL